MGTATAISAEIPVCDCYLDPVSLLFDDEALRVSEESLASLGSFTAVHLLIDWFTKVAETHCQDKRAASFGEILRDIAMKCAFFWNSGGRFGKPVGGSVRVSDFSLPLVITLCVRSQRVCYFPSLFFIILCATAATR